MIEKQMIAGNKTTDKGIRIVFQYHPAQERFFILKKKYATILFLSGLSLLVFVVGLFEVQLMALFVLIHGCFLLALLLDLFLYLQVSQQSANFAMRQ